MAMVLSALGRKTSLFEIRKLCPPGRDGTSTGSLIALARAFGVDAKAYSTAGTDLTKCVFPLIAHWKLCHWVVIESSNNRRFVIIDPSIGRRTVSPKEFSQCFSGVVLSFRKTDSFRPENADLHSSAWNLLYQIFLVIRGWRLTPVILYSSLLVQILSLSSPILIKVIVDRVLPSHALTLFPLIGAATGVAIVGFAFSSILRQIALLHLRTQFDDNAQSEILRRLLSKSFEFFQTYTSGDLLSRVTGFSTMRQFASEQILALGLDALLLLTYTGWLIMLSPALAGIVAVFAAIQTVALVSTSNYQRQLSHDVYLASSEQVSYLLDTLQGIAYVKASGSEKAALNRWCGLFRAELNANVKRSYATIVLGAVNSFCTMSGTLVLLLLGTYFVLTGKLTAGTMLSASVMSTAIFASLSNTLAVATQVQWMKALVERLEEVVDAPVMQTKYRLQVPARLQGRVELRDVSFSYPGSAKKVIEHVSMRIEPSQKVAIVGATGSGKTTLALLLLGLNAPAEGEVCYDGVPLNELSAANVRPQVGVVLQESHFFQGSIRENLTFGLPGLSMDDLEGACKITCIHDDIAALPLGYCTIMCDQGMNFSGGQRQRLALARALLRQPRILLLDEATSHMDSETELNIQRLLATVKCTQIIIAHRLSTVQEADCIFVIHEGRIVESGNHEHLLQQYGRYAQLIRNQYSHSAQYDALAM